jgi:uncharacterized membrane protein YbhN (UPF0104 family)
MRKFNFLRIFSYILTIIAFYYIYRFFEASEIDLYDRFFNLRNIPYLILISILYSSNLLIGAYLWIRILFFVTGKKISQHSLYLIYFRSNIGKYLPGNVGHYLGRNYFTNKIGVSHFEAAFSSFIEIVLMITLLATLTVLLLGFHLISLPPEVSFHFNEGLLSWLIIIGCFLLILISSLYFFMRNRKGKVKDLYNKYITYLRQLISLKFLILYFTGFITMIISFVLNGALLYLISYWVFGFDLGINNMVNFTVVSSIAGYAGILVPGVPGGIGVKESMSVFLLSYYGYDKGLLAGIFVISRICLVVSEVLLFLYSIVKGESYINASSSPQDAIRPDSKSSDTL